MKLQFDPNQDYQLDAINAVCDIFRGQEICRTEFTVTTDAADAQMRMQFAENDLGIGNRLTLVDEELLQNLNEIQLRNGLPQSTTLDSGDFTVEMETGTGKTYVYLRTIFELNRRYGFTKFVIVVPSVAIKEGVSHTIEIAAEHLKGLYGGVPFDHFIYDSANLNKVRNFATSSQIQIMVMTVGAINKFGDEKEAQGEELDEAKRREKSKNVMYRPHEDTGGEKPIDLIRATHPILIVDEPQSVEGGLDGKGKRAMERMNPLCNLRYSATPKHAHHMVYKLDAIDAYERKLVKQIEVAGATVEGGHNRPYVKFIEPVSKGNNVVGARVELDIATAGGVQRKIKIVSPLDKLEEVTKRDIYRDYLIGQEIRNAKDDKFMELRYPGGEVYLKQGESHGDTESSSVQRQMIRRTIKEHLDKEIILKPMGIKVLSLFFIDAVDKYRKYDADGTPVKGEYAMFFEQEYKKLANHPDYKKHFEGVDVNTAVLDAHGGYFSIDKKKVGSKTVDVFKDTKGTTQSDDETYSLIMRDKEKLLSFETALKFIFSHSALREGWDNPNVFQICALREMSSEQQRRQTIGRGLRICVNQDGERKRELGVNTLTVIAAESYAQFAENLQKEIEAETGMQFGIVERHHFATLPVTDASGGISMLGAKKSTVLWEQLKTDGYIDSNGKVQDSLRKVLKEGKLVVPNEFVAIQDKISALLKRVAGRLEIKNADEKRHIRTREVILQSAEFKALWNRIKQKTTYRVEFNNDKLIQECIKKLKLDEFRVTKTRLHWRKADVVIGEGGVEATERDGAESITLDEVDIELPDLLTDLQDRTQLTRRTIYKILIGSEKLNEFKRNPQQFIQLAADFINRCKQHELVDGIKYQRLGDAEFYSQELFVNNELTGYVKNLLDSKKSVYESVVYDSETERAFGDGLEKNPVVKMYAKLPGWFTVPTPLGSYNPDWAVVVMKDNDERLFFVVETKSSSNPDDLRNKEKDKINCAREHFKELAQGAAPATYKVKVSVDDFLADIT